MQTGYIYHYAFAMLVGVMWCFMTWFVSWPMISDWLKNRKGQEQKNGTPAEPRDLDADPLRRAAARRWAATTTRAPCAGSPDRRRSSALLVTLPLYTGFDTGTAGMQFVEKAPWIDRFNVRYHLGIDGISFWFVLLTAFITVIVVISAWEVITERVNQYMGAFLILSGLMIGVFCALDGLLFYVFFEATLIPMYLIIGVWGGPNKIYAAFKFFLYTLLGSLLMLVALVYLYIKSGGSFDILTWHKLPLAADAQTCCSSPSSPPSPSRCRCGRCTPGCPTCTSRRRPAARRCWPRSC